MNLDENALHGQTTLSTIPIFHAPFQSFNASERSPKPEVYRLHFLSQKKKPFKIRMDQVRMSMTPQPLFSRHGRGGEQHETIQQLTRKAVINHFPCMWVFIQIKLKLRLQFGASSNITFLFGSLGTNVVRPHEEKVIRREKEKQREIKAKFSTSWSWCKSLIFDPNAYNSIPFTAEVGLELPLPYIVMLPGLHLSMSSPPPARSAMSRLLA